MELDGKTLKGGFTLVKMMGRGENVSVQGVRFPVERYWRSGFVISMTRRADVGVKWGDAPPEHLQKKDSYSQSAWTIQKALTEEKKSSLRKNL